MRVCSLIPLFAYLLLGLFVSNVVTSNHKGSSSNKQPGKQSESSKTNESSKTSGSSSSKPGSSSKPSEPSTKHGGSSKPGSSSTSKGNDTPTKPTGSSASKTGGKTTQKPNENTTTPSKSRGSSSDNKKANKDLYDIGNSIADGVEKYFDIKQLSFKNVDGSLNHFKDVAMKVMNDVENQHNVDAKLHSEFAGEIEDAYEEILKNLTKIYKNEKVRNIVKNSENVNAAENLFENVKGRVLKEYDVKRK